MKWTDAQHSAIFAKPAQIVVSASAGSGKTQVLSTRITERVKSDTNPLSVDKLLVVTFTRAAAQEMRERIAKSIRKAIAEEQNVQKRKYLKRQLTLLGGAQICTIDSFCYDLVKKYFFKANLPSDISIGDGGELSLLLLDSLKETVDSIWCALERKNGGTLTEENAQSADFIEDFFESREKLYEFLDGFSLLTDACSSDKADSDFTGQSRFGDYTNMILDVYKKSQSAPYPDVWLDELSAMYSKSTRYEDSFFGKYALEKCIKAIKSAIFSLTEALEVSLSHSIGYENYIEGELSKLKELSEKESYSALRDFSLLLELFPRLSGKKRGCDENVSRDIKNIISISNKSVTSSLKDLLFYSCEDCDNLKERLYPQILALCECAKILSFSYYEKITERKLIDFSTCEHLALNIISPDGKTLSDEGKAVKKSYDEIYIDEFQDSNALQDTLFSLISNGNTFVVGDVKQSIYGFRNADPSILMNKTNSSSDDENSENRRITLSSNFRSRKSIIDAVNSVFDTIMIPDVCGLNYKENQRLDFGASFIPDSKIESKCEIALIEKEGNSATQRENEAKYIADKVRELVLGGYEIFDKELGIMRPIRYSDIAVLLRNANAHGKAYEDVFLRELIPVYYDGRDTFFDTSEVGQVIEILKLIDNANQDIPLASALRSPMYLFDENDLLEIKSVSREPFYMCFYKICDGEYKVNSSLKSKCDKFMHNLTLWRNASGFISIEELIRRIYTDTNIYTSALSFPDGNLRRANLDLLLEKATDFEKTSYTGLFNFVNYIEKIKLSQGSGISAKHINEKMNVVRIMSIHKSKGLEFPVVFLGECANQFSTDKERPGGLVINSGTVAMNIFDPSLRCRYPSPMKKVIEKFSREDNLSEEMRLLYVAITRAREKFYAVGTVKNIEEFEGNMYSSLKKLSLNEILSATSYLKMLALSCGHGASDSWNYFYITPESVDNEESLVKIENPAFLPDEKTAEILSYTYPYAASTILPAKASVTYLKSLDLDLSTDEYGNIKAINLSQRKHSLNKPRFLKCTSGAFYGTAHHKVFEHLKFDGTLVSIQCDYLLEKGILSEEERELIDTDAISKFIDSPLGRDIRNAQKIYREEPFVIYTDAKEISSDAPEGEKICVQGIIDFFFEKENSVVLIDFKTDRYDSPYEILERYKSQLFYYEKALKQKYKDKKIEKYLYLLHKGDIIKVD